MSVVVVGTRLAVASLAGGGSEAGVINLVTRRGEGLGGTISLATSEVYGWHDDEGPIDLAEFVPRARRLSQEVQAARTVADVARLVHNDLEECVVARRPEVGALRDRLLAEGALAAAMTGSGAAVFGLFRDADAASRARAALAPTRAWHVTDLQPAEVRSDGRA